MNIAEGEALAPFILMMTQWIIQDERADRSAPGEGIFKILRRAVIPCFRPVAKKEGRRAAGWLTPPRDKYTVAAGLFVSRNHSAAESLPRANPCQLQVLQHSLTSDLPVEDRDVLLLGTIHQFFYTEYLWIAAGFRIRRNTVALISHTVSAIG